MKRNCLLLMMALGLVLTSQASINLEYLRCESLENPLGIDITQPRLSWLLDGTGERQTAYQVLVASSAGKLKHDEGDLWDSGKVESDQSIHVRYAGKPLASQEECFWKVRVWDKDAKRSSWSKASSWSVGLLQPSDWKGKWIGKDETEKKSTLQNTSWIWLERDADKDGPVGVRYFRKAITLPDGAIKSAQLLVTADNKFTVYANEKELGGGGNFKAASAFDAAGTLHAGKNIIAVAADNTGDKANPAGLIASLTIKVAGSAPVKIVTDESWKASKEESSGWKKIDFDDSSWAAAAKLGDVGMGPWGEVGAPEDRRLAARYLRKEFQAKSKVRRATAYFSGLGLSELYINGKKMGDAVLSPGLTEYNKRSFYVTYDVTSQLKTGANAMGVILGNGRYYAPRLKVPTETRTYGFPKLLLQLHIDYDDGTSDDVVSDESWSLSTNGPIRANNEYDGEEYDARMEMHDWSKPTFHSVNWEQAHVVKEPGEKLEAQMMEPIRVTQTLKPISMKEIKPGVYIYDMGQNLVGWCRLKVSGLAGTAVSMRHAETLKDDGELYVTNLRSAAVTDTYILKGQGAEIYEPRFTYHGFRYVEVTGFPGKPSLSSLEGRAVHDDLQSAGDFACSNPLINQIYKNVVWGVADNYRSVPTDCPQRDERQGWLGDRAFESKGETYIFDTSLLQAKWLRDMADAQKESGSVPDVCPSYWPLYSDNVAWPSATIVMPEMLREQFADMEIIRSHYGSMKKWMDYMAAFIKDGVIAKDSYGDWCVPPEEQHLIHSKDPKRQTNKTLLATAYFYNDLRLMASYARALGKNEDAQKFDALATKMMAAFNTKFLNRESGQYDNGTQTSCVLPLAFGLVPDDQKERIFARLVKNITEETQGHVGTGLVGGQWLNRVLTENGRPDLVYGFATQTNYPSWGYMIGKGATTIWELWNGNTADPAMNSGNHVMLVGDLVIWFYENLAGIKSDSAQPGFKHLIMHPEPVDGLDFVRASHRSPYGMISSVWEKKKNVFTWNVTIPPNSSATVFIPANNAQSIRADGHELANAKGVKFLRMEKGSAVCELEAGRYAFKVENH